MAVGSTRCYRNAENGHRGERRRDRQERERRDERRRIKRERWDGTGEETAALSSAPRARIYRMKEGRGTWGRHVGGADAEGL